MCMVNSPSFTGCGATKFWLLNRHGSRYSDEEKLQKFVDTYDDLRSRIIQLHNEGKGSMVLLQTEPLILIRSKSKPKIH